MFYRGAVRVWTDFEKRYESTVGVELVYSHQCERGALL